MRYLFFIILLLLSIHKVIANNAIRINEFLIEPSPQQVEIINIGTQSADISGWYIDDNGGSTYYTIPQSSILYPNACMVFSGDFNLNKSSSDTVRLFDSTNLIDSFSYKSSSGSGISYLRLPDGTGNWTTKSATLGMYNGTGLSCIVTSTPTNNPTPTSPAEASAQAGSPTPTPTLTPTIVPTVTPTSYQNIYISEVMVNPQSGENEWVELINNNDFLVSLTNWFIDDIENAGSSPKLFSLDIPSKSYGIIELSSSMFNNTGDSIRLLDFNKNLIDSFEYSTSTQGKTLGRLSYDSDQFCLQEPSKGILNNSCIDSSTTSQSIQTKNPTSVPTKITFFSSPIQKTITPVLIGRNSNVNNISPGNQINEDGEILGLSDQNPVNNHNLLIRSLLFISFSYSLLTITSIVLKIKLAYIKL